MDNKERDDFHPLHSLNDGYTHQQSTFVTGTNY